jgi:3-isopropylmalate dehydrogenase
VLAGDGIGPEVMSPCVDLLRAVTNAVGGYTLSWSELDAGAAHYQRTGVSIPDDALDTARQSDAILLGAMGLPHIRYPDGTEIAPQLELREKLDLYAGVRPIKTFAGLPLPLASPRAAQLDAVLVRESTEGLFAARGHCQLDGDAAARDTMVITRRTSERLFDFAFELARKRKAQGFPGKVTCIDKANVLGSFAFFRKIFDERATRFPDIEANHCYVDAAGLRLVKSPWEFDVMVTENMFGDILSDVCAGLMGGMGMAPSADIGDEHAVFQPCHGSAPDILGQGKANPIATFLSAALMLEWLGEKHGNKSCQRGAKMIVAAVAAALQDGRLVPFELGGSAGTAEISGAVMDHVEQHAAAAIL